MAGYGVPQDDISALFDIHFQTLVKYYGKELKLGKIAANAAVAQSLFQKATSATHPQAATCAIWWSKTQMGWKDTVTLAGDPNNPLRHQHSVDFSRMPDNELSRLL